MYCTVVGKMVRLDGGCGEGDLRSGFGYWILAVRELPRFDRPGNLPMYTCTVDGCYPVTTLELGLDWKLGASVVAEP